MSIKGLWESVCASIRAYLPRYFSLGLAIFLISPTVEATSTYLCTIKSYYSLDENSELTSPPDPSYWIGQQFTVNRFTGEWDGFLDLKEPIWSPVVWSTGTLDGEFYVSISWHGQKTNIIKTPHEFARASIHLTIRPPSKKYDQEPLNTEFQLIESTSVMTGFCEFL